MRCENRCEGNGGAPHEGGYREGIVMNDGMMMIEGYRNDE
jgi:hypothetical protein